MAHAVRRSVSIAAPPERVLEVVTDFEDYPNWQKETRASTVLTRDDRQRPTRVAFTAGAAGMTVRYEIEVTYPDDGVEWHLAAGDTMTEQDARWTLHAVAGGTDVDLAMVVGLKWNLPNFMMKQIITKGVNDNLKAVKRIAEK